MHFETSAHGHGEHGPDDASPRVLPLSFTEDLLRLRGSPPEGYTGLTIRNDACNTKQKCLAPVLSSAHAPTHALRCPEVRACQSHPDRPPAGVRQAHFAWSGLS